MAEVIIKWCPNLPRTYTPACASDTKYSQAGLVYPAETQTTFSRCIESLCAAYKDGECKMFSTSVYLPAKNRE